MPRPGAGCLVGTKGDMWWMPGLAGFEAKEREGRERKKRKVTTTTGTICRPTAES